MLPPAPVGPIPPGGSTFSPNIADPPPGVPPSGPSFPTPPSQTTPSPQGPSGFDSLGNAIGNPLSSIGSALAPLKSLADISALIGKGALWIADRHNWVRILEIGVGLAGVFVGLELLSRDLRSATSQLGATAAIAAAA